jgi:Uncharacterised nucleotidyltransferase
MATTGSDTSHGTMQTLIDALLTDDASIVEPRAWSDLLALSRTTGVSGRLANQFDSVAGQLPIHVRNYLTASRRVAAKHRRTLRWEIERVAAALAPLNVPVVLLKGAAYLAQGLPPSVGRFASDIDIMVPASAISSVESALLEAGWVEMQPDAYDQRYFRDWMHEIPPLRHLLRNTVLDVHHTILPPTSRFARRLDPQLLFEAATPICQNRIATLCPADMVLHSAVHRFSEGEQPRALRDLIDMHELLRHFAAEDPRFWTTLIDRAERLGLERPLYYAIRYSQSLLGTPVPADVMSRITRHAPIAAVRLVMDRIVPRAFLGVEPTLGNRLSNWLLYIRGHYLRMPLHLLIPHLLRKWLKRRERDRADADGVPVRDD